MVYLKHPTRKFSGKGTTQLNFILFEQQMYPKCNAAINLSTYVSIFEVILQTKCCPF